MAESKLRSLSVDFSVNVVKMCDGIKGHHSLVNQLERSATSIGANIHEANYAQSKADFVAKLQISLKECYETEYWLELFIKIWNFRTRDGKGAVCSMRYHKKTPHLLPQHRKRNRAVKRKGDSMTTEWKNYMPPRLLSQCRK